MSTLRHACFTLFNFVGETIVEQFDDFYYANPVAYLVFQLEECPTTVRIHVQVTKSIEVPICVCLYKH